MHLRTWQHQMTTIMQPFQCDLQPQIQETHRTTHTGTTTRCRTQRRNRLTSKRSKPQPPHTRGTFHRRLKPLYTEKCKVSCSGFLPKTKPMQHSCSHYIAICNHKFKKRIELRTQLQELRHHLPSSPPPFLTTPLHHHFPSSPLPFLTTSHRHHLPSSPPPFVTTSCHSFLFYVMYHLSSRSIPPLLILLLCIVMLCIVRSRTTLHQGQFHRFLFFCYVSLCYVLLDHAPPFIKVNSTASYSFVMYGHVMYC